MIFLENSCSISFATNALAFIRAALLIFINITMEGFEMLAKFIIPGQPTWSKWLRTYLAIIEFGNINKPVRFSIFATQNAQIEWSKMHQLIPVAKVESNDFFMEMLTFMVSRHSISAIWIKHRNMNPNPSAGCSPITAMIQVPLKLRALPLHVKRG